MSPDPETILGALAVDYWKLLRSFERLAAGAPEEQTARLQAQARFSAARLAAHLDAYGLQLVTFDGQPITSEMPIMPINGDELGGYQDVIVDSTIEPAVVSGTRVITVGRVVAAARSV